MPSNFLKGRHKKFIDETSGTDTVSYIKFDIGTPDALTGDTDESSSYSDTPIELAGRIDYFPSKALRSVAGLNISFDAVLRIAKKTASDAGISSFSIGDAFILTDKDDKRYVTKVVPMKQSGTEFIEYAIFVTRNVKNRGN